jgi:hypothetical protein
LKPKTFSVSILRRLGASTLCIRGPSGRKARSSWRFACRCSWCTCRAAMSDRPCRCDPCEAPYIRTPSSCKRRLPRCPFLAGIGTYCSRFSTFVQYRTFFPCNCILALWWGSYSCRKLLVHSRYTCISCIRLVAWMLVQFGRCCHYRSMNKVCWCSWLGRCFGKCKCCILSELIDR